MAPTRNVTSFPTKQINTSVKIVMEHFNEKFQGTLPEGSLSGHTFEECSFQKCDFKGLDLSSIRFISCAFTSCDLSNIKLSGSRFRETVFERSKLLGIQWSQLQDLINPSFSECNLDYCGFVSLKLKKTRFFKCSVREADFSQADLSECDFSDSDFLKARFHGTTLVKADFRGALNYLIDPLTNKVKGARFSMPEALGLLSGLGVVIEN